jgi:2-iminobutanoate/2-iminopropanoate deaminase
MKGVKIIMISINVLLIKTMKSSLILFVIIFLTASIACDSGTQDKRTSRKAITFETNPVARPYSPAIESNNTLYVSGQVALDPSSGKLIEGGIEEQTKQTLKNLKNIIGHAGYTMENVVKCTVLIYDISYYSAVNKIYMEYFPKDPPARMAYAVKDLPMGALIEIDAIAVK